MAASQHQGHPALRVLHLLLSAAPAWHIASEENSTCQPAFLASAAWASPSMCAQLRDCPCRHFLCRKLHIVS